MVKLNIVHERQSKEVDYRGPVGEVAKLVGLSKQETIFKVNGKIRPDNYELRGDESVDIIKVVFGG
ncbi:MAG: hypothetical protein D6769_00420 [Methanobacteriota archaeon]|nr:MAG: hypothetical protein D6769_00420 [Euryarchaeota archaeon]